MRIVLLSLIGWCFFSGAAHAACSNPVGGPGDIIYNTDHGVVQFCDDTDWWSMKAGGSSSSSVIVGNELAACDLSRRGQLRYDQLTTWEYCNGTAWVVIDTTSTDEIQTLAQVLAQGNDAGGAAITNLATPTANSDATTKAYVDTAVGGAGGTAIYYVHDEQTCASGFGSVGTVSLGGTASQDARVCMEGAPSGGSTSGAFVLTSTTHDGNLGGRSGADALCLTNLQAYDWKNKSAFTVDAAHVKAFLCDKTTCNNLQASTRYDFARVGNTSVGGAYFVTDSSGRGPYNDTPWSGTSYFGGNMEYWLNRATETGSTVFATTPDSGVDNETCSGWTSGAGSPVAGGTGTSTQGTASRWDYTNRYCNVPKHLVCFVNPS
mgnify:CR=1 FL=1